MPFIKYILQIDYLNIHHFIYLRNKVNKADVKINVDSGIDNFQYTAFPQ